MKDNVGRQDLFARTKTFALRVIKLYVALPKSTEAQILGKQVLRSGTSIGAHYREANRAKSDADFISKIETALQELDETVYWLELIIEANLFSAKKVEPLISETRELNAIFTTMVKKVKSKKKTYSNSSLIP
jgi:four helix bundle protein